MSKKKQRKTLPTPSCFYSLCFTFALSNFIMLFLSSHKGGVFFIFLSGQGFFYLAKSGFDFRTPARWAPQAHNRHQNKM